MEGMIAQPTRQLQEYYLISCPTHLTINLWIGELIGKLPGLTHSQWILRNITKHHHLNRTIKLELKRDIMKETECQLGMGLCNLPTESKYLLEIDTSKLLDRKIEVQKQ